MGAKIGRLKKRKKRNRFCEILASEARERHPRRKRTLLYTAVWGGVFGSFFGPLVVVFGPGRGAAGVAHVLCSFWRYLGPSWGISVSCSGCLCRQVRPRSPRDRPRSSQDGPRSSQGDRRSPKVTCNTSHLSSEGGMLQVISTPRVECYRSSQLRGWDVRDDL